MQYKIGRWTPGGDSGVAQNAFTAPYLPGVTQFDGVFRAYFELSRLSDRVAILYLKI